MAIYNNNMTPIYNQRGIAYTDYRDKYKALLRQGYPESVASRMAQNIPVIYG